MSAIVSQARPTAMKAGPAAKRRKAAPRGPIVRKIWAGKVLSVAFPYLKESGLVNNRYAKVILDLEGADKAITYYFWLDKGWLYDLDGMVNAAVRVQIHHKNLDNTAKCYPVDIASIKQHMLANKIPSNHKDIPEHTRTVFQRTYTDPGTSGGQSRIKLNAFTRQVIKDKCLWPQK